MLEDRIFGSLIDPDQRLAHHRADLAGVKHLHRLTPPDPVPGQPIALALTTAGPVPFDAARCWFTVEARPPDPSSSAPITGEEEAVIDLQAAGVAWDTIAWDYVRRWTGTLPPQPAGAMIRYRLAARLAGTDQWVFADNQTRRAADATEFAVWVDDGAAPEWARAALVYHVFLDRFYPGDGRPWLKPSNLSGFFGGTLRGVIHKLDYIQSLGCNALWLSPLFASPSHHGYDATDYYAVEPRLGTNADLKELIEAAHARGMRVMLDFVANHWSHLHPTFQSARRDPRSPYQEWYTWHAWPDDYETYFGVKELPQLNLRRGPARDYLLECARYWLRQGVDGYRLDYAYGPPHDFWADFRRACRSARPDCWLFGEIIRTAPMQLSYAPHLDGTLDFLLARALRETFARGAWDLAQFEAFLAAHEAYFPASFSRPAFLDNHDMNRFLFAADGHTARVKLGALVLFTLSGPPIVYYGTEAAVTQERPIHQNDFGIFEEARLPMKWGDEQDGDLVAYFRRLGSLRRSHPVLHQGARRVVHLDAGAGTYAYVRESASDRVLVALNLSPASRTIRLPLAGLSPEATDRLNDHPARVGADGVRVDLPAQGGAFVV
jgi:glycosidase